MRWRRVGGWRSAVGVVCASLMVLFAWHWEPPLSSGRVSTLFTDPKGLEGEAEESRDVRRALFPIATAQPPAVGDALLERFRSHVVRQEWSAALGLVGALPRVSDPERAFLAAKLLAAKGEWTAAAEAFAKVDAGSLSAALRPGMRREQAVALAHAGDCLAALPLLAEAAEGEVSAATFRARYAECLGEVARQTPARTEDAETALVAVVAEDARGVDTFSAARALADLRWRAGRQEQAVAGLRALVVARPEHPGAVHAVRQWARWSGQDLAFDRTEHLSRAERLVATRHYRSAIRELEALAGLSTPESETARQRRFHLMGTALFRMRNHYDDAARWLTQSAEAGGPKAVRDAFLAARAWARAGDSKRAIRRFQAFARVHGRHRKVPEALYLAAWLELLDEGVSPRQRIRALEQFELRPPRRGASVGRFVRAARWHLGLHHLRQGNSSYAAELFARTRGSSRETRVSPRPRSDPFRWGRSVYWQARAEHDAGNRARAVVLYRALQTSHPLHWYGLWARRRLQQLDVSTQIAPVPADASGSNDDPALPEGVAFYHRLGFARDARAMFRRQEARIRSAVPARQGLQHLVRAYHLLGEFERPYRLVQAAHKEALSALPDGDTRWVWEAACPRAFRQEVEAAGRAEGVAPWLLWGVMRQESVFDPHALSYANAAGLLQLLPATAERLARSGEPRPNLERLFVPATNTQWGARYLAQLTRDFPLPLAIAAYNAGERRAADWSARWLSAGGEPGTEVSPFDDLDFLVERVPIDQTRNYVRRVVSHAACYVHLYEAEGTVDRFPVPLASRVIP